jgi:hypothetical protein
MSKKREMIDNDLIDNLLSSEIDFGNYKELEKEYGEFKKLSREKQLIMFKKSPLLRALALSVFPTSIIDNLEGIEK